MRLRQNNFQTYLSLAILLLGASWIWASAAPVNSTTQGNIPAPRTGFIAPGFSLQTLSGQPVRLSELRGQAVLINFWASWCKPCQAEMPAIENVYQDYKDYGLTILAVNTTQNDSNAKITEFISDYGLSFPILLDYEGETSRAYNLMATPTTFFIDPKGVIQDVVIGGPMAEALLRTQVEKILPEQP